jgi:hypothetical protein
MQCLVMLRRSSHVLPYEKVDSPVFKAMFDELANRKSE